MPSDTPVGGVVLTKITLEDEYADNRVIALGQWIKMVATSSGSHHVPWMPPHISSCISSQL
jgi:hypothetical protein